MSVSATNILGHCHRRRCRRDFHHRRWWPILLQHVPAQHARPDYFRSTASRPRRRCPHLLSTAHIGSLHDPPLFSSVSLLAKQLTAFWSFCLWSCASCWCGCEGAGG